MTAAKPLHDFMKYASLSVMAMIAMSCYILADTFFVSQGLGTRGLAALNLAIPAYNFIHGTGLMLGMGGATRFSILKSQDADREANRMYTVTLYLSLIFSVLFVLTGLFLSGGLARLLGADPAVFDMTNTYLKVLLLFSPAFILNDVLLCFVRNDGNPQLAMAATITGSLSNIVLDYVFIFPCGMGIFGAVFATGLAPVIGILVMAPHWLKRDKGFHIISTGLPARAAGITLSLGFPSLLAQLSSGIVMIVFNTIILGLLGNTGVAAYGVIANISLVVTSIFTGIAQGVQPLISQAYGRKETNLVGLYLKYSMISMAVFSAAVCFLLFIFASPTAGIFNSEGDPQLQKTAVEGIRLYFTSTPFTGFNIILSTWFASVEKALPAQIISLLRGLILIIPAAFLMASLWGMTGVWLALTAAEVLTGAAGLFFFRRSRGRLYHTGD
ncbi:MAG TPA: MATE family efflux transporter [Candidatus Scatomonas merdigallinarum]|nr:MATE family efflux transporter [Candidatus Scatomonas merdigallinarum]